MLAGAVAGGGSIPWRKRSAPRAWDGTHPAGWMDLLFFPRGGGGVWWTKRKPNRFFASFLFNGSLRSIFLSVVMSGGSRPWLPVEVN